MGKMVILRLKIHFIAFLIVLLYPWPLMSYTQNQYFQKLVGPEAEMDNTITVDFILSQPDKKVYLDTDNDQKIDTIYMIDTGARHGDTRQPLLVKIVDEDGDMDNSMMGDYDSDLYIADWYGDGTVDRVIDYNDTDHDNDVDEQYLYGFRNQEYYVAWAKDYGDDNRLWYDVNYEYSQLITQWKTDFNGDEMFVYWFRYDFDKNTLTPCMENAFSFYDLDGDTYSEEAVRFTGTGPVAEDLRYSMDIDNDNEFNEPYHHDYDFSISSLGPIDLPMNNCRMLNIRGIETEPIVKWEDMRALSKTGNWIKTHLTWDENDNNITLIPGRQYYERWEGVLNHPNDYMIQIGGPSCGPFNKRNEIDLDASGNMQFYYSSVDHRMHLFGAEVGFIKVDYDYDETMDMYVFMEDQDKDGFFDIWKYDIDGNYHFELVYTISDDSTNLIPFDYNEIQAGFVPALVNHIQENDSIIASLKKIVTALKGHDYIDPVENYFDTGILNYGTDYSLGEKVKNSKEGKRYYQDLVRFRLWHIFLRNANFFGWPCKSVEDKYKHGKFAEAAQLIEENFKSYNLNLPVSTKLYNNFPNPFKESTFINYYLEKDNFVKIKIYSISGQEIELLVNKIQKAGFYELEWDAHTYPAGLYFCYMETKDIKTHIKMILIR